MKKMLTIWNMRSSWFLTRKDASEKGCGLKAMLLILVILSILIPISCKKALDIKPNSFLSTPETLEDLQALLDADGPYMISKITPSAGESSADDYFLLQSTYDNTFDDRKRPYIWQPQVNASPGGAFNDWGANYNPVFTANLCLEQVEKIQRTNENKLAWDNVKGSSLFFRAYYFLQLSWNFSKAYDDVTSTTDLGIAIRLQSDINIPSIRSNVKDSYDQIISDAKNAVVYLPDLGINCYRPCKASAYGLLARTYLSMRFYDSAFKYADLSLQLNSQLMNYNSDGDILSGIALTDQPFKRFNKETIFYTEMNNNNPTYQPTIAKIDTTLYNSYTSNDLRKALFFRSSGAYYDFRGSYAATDEFRQFSGIATDEIYLIRAESYARLDNKDAALVDLNTLMATRWQTGTFIPFTASSSSEALSIILSERRKELLFRGLRWMDIKRQNKEGANIILRRFINNEIIELPPNSDKYALQLPLDIINITGMPQNPGW